MDICVIEVEGKRKDKKKCKFNYKEQIFARDSKSISESLLCFSLFKFQNRKMIRYRIKIKDKQDKVIQTVKFEVYGAIQRVSEAIL